MGANNGVNNNVWSITSNNLTDIWCGGAFTTAAGGTVATVRIARWNTSGNWYIVGNGGGMDAEVRKLLFTKNQLLMAGGEFNNVDGYLCGKLAVWNGSSWKPLFTNSIVYDMAEDNFGYIHCVGGTQIATDDYVSYYLISPSTSLSLFGSSHTIRAISSAQIYAILMTNGGVILGGNYLILQTGYRSTYINMFARQPKIDLDCWTTVRPAYPITVETYYDSEAITTFPGVLQIGESSILTPVKWTSNFGDKSAYLSRTAGGFLLDTGSNYIHAMCWNNSAETNDNNNQLRYWWAMTGMTAANTDYGRVYISIVADGGGFYHVNVYRDAARANLVGHTASYNATGWQAVVPDAASGLGGYINIQAVTAADADIYVDFGLCTTIMYYPNVIRALSQARFS